MIYDIRIDGQDCNLRLDPVDAPAIEFKEWAFTGGSLRVKAPAWRRWKSFSCYLTGTECTHRNGDPFDFRRDNLRPVLAPWRVPGKWT